MFDFSEGLLLEEDSQSCGGGADDVVSVLQRFRSLNCQLGMGSGSFAALGQTAQGELIKDFERYFSVQVVQSAAQMRQLMRLRYWVYCDEFAYERAENYPDQLEVDEFDARAIHCVIVHKSTGRSAGCVRVVASHDNYILPLEQYCDEALYPSHKQAIVKDRQAVNEVSRLAVAPEFRRFSSSASKCMGFNEAERACLPLIAMAGYMAVFVLARMCGRRHCYAVMEPFLPRLLRRSGVHFERVGHDLEYHGKRAPYVVDTQDVLDGISLELQQWFDRMYANFYCTLDASAVTSVQHYCEKQFSLLTQNQKQSMLEVS